MTLPPKYALHQAGEMATRTRKAKVSLLDDRIEVLNREAIEASSAKQVFRTVSATIALVRVGVIFCIQLWTPIGNPSRTR